MKVVILAGGMGTRLTEETQVRPKPMVEVGGKPLIWHIMQHYAHHGFTEFVVALGYKGDFIKRYFLDYRALSGDLTIDLATGNVTAFERSADRWTVHLVDTGLDVMTGGRVRRLQSWLGNEPFLLTYGDGLSDVDLGALVGFHRSCGRIATVTAVRPPARFGGLVFDGNLVSEFTEKPQIGEGWINGGFMVLEPALFRYLGSDATVLETDALEALAAEGQLAAYRHESFWQCVDTMRELRILQALWEGGQPPWRIWG